MAARYSVEDESPYYFVRDRNSDEEIPDYYCVAQEVNGLECDGMPDICEEGKCQHIKAVNRYLANK